MMSDYFLLMCDRVLGLMARGASSTNPLTLIYTPGKHLNSDQSTLNSNEARLGAVKKEVTRLALERLVSRCQQYLLVVLVLHANTVSCESESSHM